MENAARTRKNLIMFPLGTIGRDAIYQLFTNYILTFVLFTRALTAAQLAAISAIMVGARIFDALNDPVMGNIVDRTRTKYGKFKPWLIIGIISTSIVVYLAFNTKLQGWSFIWFFGVIYFLYSITYTMHDISYWGMIPSLGTDAHTRDQFTSRAILFAGVGSTLASVLIPMLTTGSMTIGSSTAYAYGKVALVACLLSPLFLCFTIFGVHENLDYNTEPIPPVSFQKILTVFRGNDQLIWVSLIFLIQQIGQNIVLGGIGSTYIYFEFGYEGGYFSLFTTVGIAATAFLMVFYPTISARIHRKPLMKIMMIISTVGYVIMLICGLIIPTGISKFWSITIGYMLANFGNYCFYLILMISIINTVEYNEFKNGERDDAIIASVRPFLTKLSSALIVIITTSTYILFGITSYTNQISALEQQASLGTISETDKLMQIQALLSSVSHTKSIGLLCTITILPFLLMLASYLLYKKHYKLDEEVYERICSELTIQRSKEI